MGEEVKDTQGNDFAIETVDLVVGSEGFFRVGFIRFEGRIAEEAAEAAFGDFGGVVMVDGDLVGFVDGESGSVG